LEQIETGYHYRGRYGKTNTATDGQAIFNREGTHWLKQTHAYARVCRPFKILKK